MHFNRIFTFAFLLGTFALAHLEAQEWANWRGPNYNGSAEASNLPVKFAPTSGVKWSASLPGASAGTPIIYKDNVFITAADKQTEELLAICLNSKTGKEKWRHSVGTGYMAGGEGNKIMLEDRSNYASPSPVTDGKNVIFFFGNGDLACFDLSGSKKWQRNIQKEYGDFAFQWTFSSTPQLYGGKLYLQVLQRNKSVGQRGKEGAESFLLALDPGTGKEIWKHVRPTSAVNESREAYSTPIPYIHNGRKELIVSGGDILTGHDPESGKELWRWGTWNEGHREIWFRLVPSPVTGDGVVLGCGPKRMPVFAARAGGNGDIGTAGLVWKSEDRGNITTDVPTPLYYKGHFYVLSDVKKTLSCVEPANGHIMWSTPIPGTSMCWGSPTGADGKIYAFSLTGDVHVFDATNGACLATNPMAMDERDMKSTIAIAHGCLFIRTNTKLFCVGN